MIPIVKWCLQKQFPTFLMSIDYLKWINLFNFMLILLASDSLSNMY